MHGPVIDFRLIGYLAISKTMPDSDIVTDILRNVNRKSNVIYLTATLLITLSDLCELFRPLQNI